MSRYYYSCFQPDMTAIAASAHRKQSIDIATQDQREDTRDQREDTQDQPEDMRDQPEDTPRPA